MSEDEYNEFIKAKRNADYIAMIDKLMTEIEVDRFVIKNIPELKALE